MKDQLNCTLVQTELLWEDVAKNLQHFSSKIERVENTDLILLPEMFSTGFTMNPYLLAEKMDGRTINWMREEATKANAVIGGSLIIKSNNNFFNRFVAVYPDGNIRYYDKRHLFTLAREDESYDPGNDRIILDIKGWKVLPLICYDLRFPVWSRSQKSTESAWEYDVLIYVANWPTVRMNAWDALLKARAIENQAYCIGVNRIGTDPNDLHYSGHTAAYDFMGDTLIDLENKDEARQVNLDRVSLDTFRKKLPFQRDGDDFEVS